MPISDEQYAPRWLWEEFVRLARQLPNANFSIAVGETEPTSVSSGEGDGYRAVIYDIHERYVYAYSFYNHQAIIKNKISAWLDHLGF